MSPHASLQEFPPDAASPFSGLNLIGQSPAFCEALRKLERLAASQATVLIQGETGTGKELAARAVHYLGPRQAGPFIAINCGAIPDNLLENELFGHARGAFTDAREGTPGLVAQAEGGALFLDEVEALSPRGQVVLLRFLQDGSYRPLGSNRVASANVRVIAASNADVNLMVSRKELRADLMYRLAIMCLDLPSLRDREGDVSLLARHFVRRFNAQYGRAVHLPPETCRRLENHHWPGNVRELENLLHREVLLCEGQQILLPPCWPGAGEARVAGAVSPDASVFELGFSAAKALHIAEFERTFVSWALAQSGGNVSAAARRAGKERRSFGRLLKKHRILRPTAAE
jgi:two-component system, NtrC family, response regulator GlrR